MIDNGGFRLNNVPAKQLGLQLIRDAQRPVLPPTVDYGIQIPGRNGVWDHGADLGPKTFTLNCGLIKRNDIHLQTAVSQLAAFLVDRYGKPRPLELIFDYQPDRKYYVRYAGDLAIDRIAGFGRIAMPLVAFDPHAYALQETILQDVVETSPYPFPAISNGNVSTPSVIELTNEGTETITYFKIKIEYPVD
jgi:predicted phage tail component-like protein